MFPLSDESKVFDGASKLQLDCMVEESSGSSTVKHDGLLSLTDLSHPDDFPVPPHNGPSLTEMSSPLPIEPSDIKLDPAAGDTPASTGERKVLTVNGCNTLLLCCCSEQTLSLNPFYTEGLKMFLKKQSIFKLRIFLTTNFPDV